MCLWNRFNGVSLFYVVCDKCGGFDGRLFLIVTVATAATAATVALVAFHATAATVALFLYDLYG